MWFVWHIYQCSNAYKTKLIYTNHKLRNSINEQRLLHTCSRKWEPIPPRCYTQAHYELGNGPHISYLTHSYTENATLTFGQVCRSISIIYNAVVRTKSLCDYIIITIVICQQQSVQKSIHLWKHWCITILTHVTMLLDTIRF